MSVVETVSHAHYVIEIHEPSENGDYSGSV
jgi:hypothetical protein